MNKTRQRVIPFKHGSSSIMNSVILKVINLLSKINVCISSQVVLAFEVPMLLDNSATIVTVPAWFGHFRIQMMMFVQHIVVVTLLSEVIRNHPSVVFDHVSWVSFPNIKRL